MSDSHAGDTETVESPQTPAQGAVHAPRKKKTTPKTSILADFKNKSGNRERSGRPKTQRNSKLVEKCVSGNMDNSGGNSPHHGSPKTAQTKGGNSPRHGTPKTTQSRGGHSPRYQTPNSTHSMGGDSPSYSTLKSPQSTDGNSPSYNPPKSPQPTGGNSPSYNTPKSPQSTGGNSPSYSPPKSPHSTGGNSPSYGTPKTTQSTGGNSPKYGTPKTTLSPDPHTHTPGTGDRPVRGSDSKDSGIGGLNTTLTPSQGAKAKTNISGTQKSDSKGLNTDGAKSVRVRNAEKRKQNNSNRESNRNKGGGSNELTTWSKKLSYVLRHGAEKDGVPIGADGFVKITDLTSHKKFRGLTLDIIQRIAKEDTKGRYKIEERDGELLVRANQGHSIANVSALALTPILSGTTYPVCIHGTFRKAWGLIEESGLKTMNRNHIHCARGLPGESGVISGMRTSCQVLIYIDMAASIKDGMEWFASANDVILTSGFDGVIPPKYFSSVVTNKGESLL